MSTSQGASEKFFAKKVFEINYAIFRISTRLANKSLAGHLEERGLDLMERVARGAYGDVGREVGAIGHLLRLGVEVGLIHPTNAEVITDEMARLNSAVVEFEKYRKPAKVDLDQVFSRFPEEVEIRSGNTELENGDLPLRREVPPRKENLKVNQESFIQNQGFKVGSKMRQSAILVKMRQIGNLPDRQQIGCRLKDIQETLPHVSERTLRYDLQNLIQEGMIERIGSGGPATYYRVLTGRIGATPEYQESNLPGQSSL